MTCPQHNSRRADATSPAEAVHASLGIGTWCLYSPAGRMVWDETMRLLLGCAPEPSTESLDLLLAAVPEPGRAAVARGMWRSLAQRSPLELLCQIVRGDGERRTMILRAYPGTCGDMPQAALRGVCVDVTDALRPALATRPISPGPDHGHQNGTQMVEPDGLTAVASIATPTQLERTSRLASIGELTAAVLHEINNPLNSILNGAQLVIDGDDPKFCGNLILAEAQRITQVVRDVFDCTQPDGPRPVMTLVPDLVRRTVRLVGDSLRHHGIHLHLHLAGELPSVLIHPLKLQHVLLCLLANSRDALLEQSSRTNPACIDVQVGAGQTPGLPVSIKVRDNGTGIPADLQGRIFQLFFTTKRQRGGAGIGLAVSRQILEACGGRIGFESVPGSHSEFRIELPLPQGS